MAGSSSWAKAALKPPAARPPLPTRVQAPVIVVTAAQPELLCIWVAWLLSQSCWMALPPPFRPQIR